MSKYTDRAIVRQRERARGFIANEIKQGRLTRPTHCGKCGRDPGRGKDGRSLIHGHHHKGHEHLAEIEWLCVQCHRDETPLSNLRGETVGTSKLTTADVIEIRRSALNCPQLARIYGVHRSAVLLIKRRKTWAHIP